jgi:WD40 repeat protein
VQTGVQLLEPLPHKAKIFTVEFSKDGNRLLTASSDGTAQQWNATTGAKIGLPIKHERNVPMLSAAYSADDKRIVTASFDGTARVWAAETGAGIGRAIHIGSDTATLQAMFSANGRRIATLSTLGVAQLWDVETATAVGPGIGSEQEKVTSIDFSPDGMRLVTASSDGSARLWNAEDGSSAGSPLQHNAALTSASFSPDGAAVLTGSQDRTARLWDARSGNMIAEFTHDAAVLRAIFSRDGKKIATACDDHVARLWEVDGRRLIATFNGHRGVITRLAFSPDSTTILTASGDHTARLWDARVGTYEAVLGGGASIFRGASISPSGERIITLPDPSRHTGGVPSAVERSAGLWDARTMAPIAPLEPVPELSAAYWPTHVNFSPDGERVVMSAGFQRAGLWNANKGGLLAVLQGPFGGPIDDAEFNADGSRLVTANADGTSRLWDAKSGAAIALLLRGDEEAGRKSRGRAIAKFRPDGEQILTSTGEDILWLWNGRTGEYLAEIATHEGPITHAAFSTDGTRILSIHKKRLLKIWSTETLQPLDSTPLSNEADAAEFGADGTRVLVEYSEGGAPELLDGHTGKLVARLSGHTARILSVRFNRNGTRVLSIGHDGIGQLWDAATGKLIAKLVGVRGPIQLGTFSADGTRIVTASREGALQVWESHSGLPMEVFLGLDRRILSVDTSANGTRLATSTRDAVQLWRMPSASIDTRLTRARAAMTIVLNEKIRQRYALNPQDPVEGEAMSELLCDRLAGDALDPKHKGSGVGELAKEAAQNAKEACSEEIQKYPNEPRLRYQRARALVALQQWPEAIQDLVVCEQADYAAAYFLHGQMHAQGAGEPQSGARALGKFERAFALGMVVAADSAATLKWSGADGRPADRRAALATWTEGAKHGDPFSHSSLGSIYEQPEVAELGKALFHHAVAAALFGASGSEVNAGRERARRAALATTLPAADVAQIMRAAEVWKPGEALP